MKTKIKRMLGGFIAVGLVVAVPAFAADSVSYGGGTAQIQPGTNNMIRACDTQVDGHQVRAWLRTNTQNQGDYTTTPFAPSGGCTEYMGGGWGSPITEFRVCVEAEGCSPWVRR